MHALTLVWGSLFSISPFEIHTHEHPPPLPHARMHAHINSSGADESKSAQKGGGSRTVIGFPTVNKVHWSFRIIFQSKKGIRDVLIPWYDTNWHTVGRRNVSLLGEDDETWSLWNVIWAYMQWLYKPARGGRVSSELFSLRLMVRLEMVRRWMECDTDGEKGS